MKKELALNVLSKIMAWDDARAREEFRWLKLMARLKYDGYRDFQAGMRFVETLATWLQQFRHCDREAAYSFVRNELVYIAPSEMQRLVEQFYPRVLHHRLVNKVAQARGLQSYAVLGNPQALAEMDQLRHRTLIMGLSDGARIDILRHANVGRLSTEQMVLATQLDDEKWKGLLDELRKTTKDPKALFRLVYLVDDFMGTGSSFLRKDPKTAAWKGKLFKFKKSIKHASDQLKAPLLEPDWELCVHHYVATHRAVDALETNYEAARGDLTDAAWAAAFHPTFGVTLPRDLPIDGRGVQTDIFRQLTQTYYDPGIETEHTDVGGVKHIGLGYGRCALPLVLDHNTPNNSIALLWAQSLKKDDGPPPPHLMRPLFRRRQRHV